MWRDHLDAVSAQLLVQGIAKLVSNIRQQPPQNLIAAPSLKAPMYRFVVGIALRQHMPLRTCVEKRTRATLMMSKSSIITRDHSKQRWM
jgi:hypothetical protein